MGRKGWFDCSCCPTNVVRFLPSIAGYIYAQRERDLFVNLYLVLPDDAPLEARSRPDLLGGVTVIEGRALALYPSEDGRSVVTREQDLVAVPYYAWAHRGDGEMAVWLPRQVQLDFRIP